MMILNADKIARAILGLLFVSFFRVGDAAAQSCYLPFVWENQNRHVFGDVSVECGSCGVEWEHWGPWGNWGVDSVTASRSNSSPVLWMEMGC